MLRIPRYSVRVQRIIHTGNEFQANMKFGAGFRRLTGGGNDGEPAGDEVAGGEPSGRDLDGSDDLGAEEIVVFDVEVEVEGGVGDGDVEVLVPVRVLGVGEDARAGEGGLGDGDGDVRVAGDDFAVVTEFLGGGLGGGAAGFQGQAALEAAGY